MGLSVVFVSGPRRSGKSTVIRMMIDRLLDVEPHYIRLVSVIGDKEPPKCTVKPPDNCGLASARWLEYDAEHVFDILPAAVAAIHRRDARARVVIEADADPALRCAYPYDHRVFVMPVPSRIDEVFREPSHAADELHRALDDTVAFASEIFGMFSQEGQEDADPPEERADLSDSQMRGFLYSPLGDELATRIQLQPPYHGLVESDVIVVNTGAGEVRPKTPECLRRVEQLLVRLRPESSDRALICRCDPRDRSARDSAKLLDALRPMCTNVRS